MVYIGNSKVNKWPRIVENSSGKCAGRSLEQKTEVSGGEHIQGSVMSRKNQNTFCDHRESLTINKGLKPPS